MPVGRLRQLGRAAILSVKAPVFPEDLCEPVPASDAAIPVGMKRDRDAGAVVRMPHLKLRSLGEDLVPDLAFLCADGKLYIRGSGSIVGIVAGEAVSPSESMPDR